jgi:hypothetical protein
MDTVRAVFKPKRIDDLRTDAVECIGQVAVWYEAWVIEDGPYEGQRAFIAEQPRLPMGWVPESDLDILGPGVLV